MSLRLLLLDNKEFINDAVRQGQHLVVENYLNKNPQCINQLFQHETCQWTFLIAACFFKHEEMARMLLKRFKPDVEVQGTVVFDESTNNRMTYEGVSALWTAAAVDHFDIVRLLIEHGQANVNFLTKTHNTPLRVAFYNNNYEMIKYLIDHGANPYQSKLGNYTNLMLSAGRGYLSLVIYSVEQLKYDLNERDEDGDTALHYAVKSNVREIVKYLLDHGALNLPCTLTKITPLMRAALCGQIEVFETFHGHCSDLEWIEGKELLGASFAGWIPELENRNKTVQYLTEALALRRLKNLPKERIEQPLDFLERRTECATLEEFNQLVNSNSIDAFHVETILIYQRLLGDLSYRYQYVLRCYGAKLAQEGRSVESCPWWLRVLELQQNSQTKIDQKDLQRLLVVFIQIESNTSAKVSFDILQRALTIIDREVRSKDAEEQLDCTLMTLLRIITIIGHYLPGEGNLREAEQLRRSISSIIARQYRTKGTGSSFLHLCCDTSSMAPPINSKM
jgi:hypothetical protein